MRNYRRKLSTTEDTEDRRLKPEENVHGLRVPRVLRGGELNSATRFKGCFSPSSQPSALSPDERQVSEAEPEAQLEFPLLVSRWIHELIGIS